MISNTDGGARRIYKESGSRLSSENPPLAWSAMAKYQVLRWGGIPTGVRARDGDRTATEHLHDRFQNAVDAVATATGRTDTEGYLSEWRWSTWEERDGGASEVARAVAEELEAEYPSDRLREIRAKAIAEGEVT